MVYGFSPSNRSFGHCIYPWETYEGNVRSVLILPVISKDPLLHLWVETKQTNLAHPFAKYRSYDMYPTVVG